MTYSEAIQEILQRSDEAFIGVSESRAREYFNEAIIELLKNDKYKEEDIRGFLELNEITLSTSQAEKILINDLDSSTTVINVKDIYPAIEEDNLMITETDLQQVRRMPYISDFKGDKNNVYYYKYGRYIYFQPKDSLSGKKIVFAIVKTPPEYVSGGSGNWEWHDDTILNDWMSATFIKDVLDIASKLFISEINRGQ